MHPQLQIVRAVQVWVCDTCGGQDHKSCGCNSTAHLEELAAKREANRQAVNRYAEKKRKENQGAAHNVRDVENIEENDDDQLLAEKFRKNEYYATQDAKIIKANNYNAFLMNCHASAAAAVYSGHVDDKALAACRMTAEAWSKLLKEMETKYGKA